MRQNYDHWKPVSELQGVTTTGGDEFLQEVRKLMEISFNDFDDVEDLLNSGEHTPLESDVFSEEQLDHIQNQLRNYRNTCIQCIREVDHRDSAGIIYPIRSSMFNPVEDDLVEDLGENTYQVGSLRVELSDLFTMDTMAQVGIDLRRSVLSNELWVGFGSDPFTEGGTSANITADRVGELLKADAETNYFRTIASIGAIRNCAVVLGYLPAKKLQTAQFLNDSGLEDYPVDVLRDEKILYNTELTTEEEARETINNKDEGFSVLSDRFTDTSHSPRQEFVDYLNGNLTKEELQLLWFLPFGVGSDDYEEAIEFASELYEDISDLHEYYGESYDPFVEFKDREEVPENLEFEEYYQYC